MQRLQPTVRQLEPLGRRRGPAPDLAEQVEPIRAAETSLPDPAAGAPRRPRWRRWLAARARPSS